MTRNPGSSGARPPRTHPRTLYLVDLENVAGASEICYRDVATAQRRIQAAIPAGDGDQTVIAASHHNGAACLGWKGPVLRKWRSGPNGADLALLEHVEDIAWTADRFDRVVIASGDQAFALTVRALKNAGIDVVVVRPDLGMSKALHRAAEARVVPMGSAHPRQIITLLSPSKDAA